jgi:hypothetical protein
MHEPGTGKTRTELNAAMELLMARFIRKIYIINRSEKFNKEAMKALKELYNVRFSKYFKFRFPKFANIFVKLVKQSQIAAIDYEDNSCIIIDEAHNLFSDDTGKEPRKVDDVRKFINRVSALRGVKIILATATPMMGEVQGLYDLSKVLFRSQQEREIPPSMISYTKINYSHLNIVQMMNDEYDFEDPERPGRRYGDMDFFLGDGVLFPLKLYVNKPTALQIVDFLNLIITQADSPFLTSIRPPIICSSEYIHPETGQPFRQSAILDSIIEHANETEDGTVVIYAELVGRGIHVVADYLKAHGIMPYIADEKGGKKKGVTKEDPELNKQIKKRKDEIKEVKRRIDNIKQRFAKLDEQDVVMLERQLK